MEVHIEIVVLNVFEYLVLCDGVDVTARPAVQRAQERRNRQKVKQEILSNPVTLVQSHKLQARKRIKTDNLIEEFVRETANKLKIYAPGIKKNQK